MPFENKANLDRRRGNPVGVPRVRVRVRAFRIPIIRDAAIIGRASPIEREAMAAAVGMATAEAFFSLDLRDSSIGSILVRESVLRKIGGAAIVAIAQNRIEPLMAASEIMALKLEVEVVLAENFFGPSARGGGRAEIVGQQTSFTLPRGSTTSASFQPARSSPKIQHLMRRVSKRPSKAASVKESSETNEQYVRVRVKALEIPPVKDGIVIGRTAPMGADAMLRTLKLMSTEVFVRLVVAEDDTISDVIVRQAVLRKLKEDRLRAFILKRIKPLMTENELLMLDMDIEVVVEDTL